MSDAFLLKEHKEWIGLLQPVGLVVAPSALVRAQLRLQKDVFNLQETFCSITDKAGLLPLNLPQLFSKVLGWRPEDLISGEEIKNLDAYLPERETLLKTDYAVKNVDTGEFDILIKFIDQLPFDDEVIPEGRGWQATPHAKFERHLREKNIPTGIIINQMGLRLVYAPKGETSGYLTFPFRFMHETQGRPVLAALHLLLGEDRLFKGDPKQRLHALLIESRKFQNEVSTQLSEQVLAALYELVRGLQEADEDSKGELLEEVLKKNKNDIYHGLLTVLLRIVFTLYAEDRDLLSSDSVFLNNYSINGLFAKLREDASKHHDSMNLRYGAWAHLLSLFRIIFEGIDLDTESIPGRKGHLFDPDRFPFLEGRAKLNDEFKPPRVSDGVVWRVLSNLMNLDGERISYRALDVEQIGSVYETVMGFQLEIASGPSIAIKPSKSHGAPVVVNLRTILSIDPEGRAAKLKELTDNNFEGKVLGEIKSAKSPEELVAAISYRVADWATPTTIGSGAMILQPSDERRRSGSHYTPRTLTAPLVEKAIEPIFANLGKDPTPEQILNLKVCDPAMGSGAFLVEACRQLSERLVKSWALHKIDVKKKIPLDEDELLYARRLISQKCLYGVDKNPMAVNLAKLSLWLATFARNHDFTFLDHCLKSGDSLVGLDLSQILGRSWVNANSLTLQDETVRDRLSKIGAIRFEVRNSDQSRETEELMELKKKEDDLLKELRIIADVVLYSFFAHDSRKARMQELDRINLVLQNWFSSKASISAFDGLKKEAAWIKDNMNPFNWQIEFPEVFDQSYGFDIILGNPPFMSGVDISKTLGVNYNSYLFEFYKPTSRKADLSSYFVRQAAHFSKKSGVISLITTNTISQGETRKAGLDYIISGGFEIYFAVSDFQWPGTASVIASMFALFNGKYSGQKSLNDRQVESISSTFDSENFKNEKPLVITVNKDLCYQGVCPYGEGFVVAPSVASALIRQCGEIGSKLILPTIGGTDINSLLNPDQSCRYVIDVGEMTENQIREIPPLYEYLRLHVYPERQQLDKKKYPRLVDEWWKLWHSRHVLFEGIKRRNLKRLIARARVSNFHCLIWVSTDWRPLETVTCFQFDDWFHFGVLQSFVHETWVRKWASTLKTDIRYTIKDCFHTFPFPQNSTSVEEVAKAAEEMYSLRAALQAESKLPLSKIFNQINNPGIMDKSIVSLRDKIHALDVTVLSAYGWHDLTNGKSDFYSPDETAASGKAKIKYRYQWPVLTRDLVIQRLLEINQQIGTNVDSKEEEDL
jgi:hypothetical protein